MKIFSAWFVVFSAALWLTAELVLLLNHNKSTKGNKKKNVYMTILFFYFVFLISITLFPVCLPLEDNRSPRVFSLKLSKSINDLLANHTNGSVIVNLLGNIGIFVPLGLLLPLWKPGFRKFYKVAGAGFLLTLLIELIQLSGIPYNREFDILDIILNITGALSGYLLYCLFCRNIKGDWQ